jgi:chaperonin cofactor prefoldin
MGKKKLSLKERISTLKKQQEEIREVFIKLQGAIEVLETINKEENEKTD